MITDRYATMLRDLLRMYTSEALELRVILNPSAQELPAPETTDPPVEAASNSQPPAWITAERWAALPVMLRAALAGSELVDGVVQGRSPFFSRQLHNRYTCEVDALVAETATLS